MAREDADEHAERCRPEDCDGFPQGSRQCMGEVESGIRRMKEHRRERDSGKGGRIFLAFGEREVSGRQVRIGVSLPIHILVL